MTLKDIDTCTTHGEHLCHALLALFQEKKASFQHKLLPDVSYIHYQAECEPDIKISDIKHLINNKYQLTYQVKWFLFSGCMDLNEQGSLSEQCTFSIENNGKIQINFPINQQRTTADEL